MQLSTSIKTLAFSIIGTLVLGISLCTHAATFPNRYVTNADGTALEIIVGTNSVDFGTNDNRSVLIDDAVRIPGFPVMVLRPVVTNISMVLDLMPSGDGMFTNSGTPFLTAIDLVNRNLSIVADNTNFYVARFALKTNVVIIGGSAGGTNDAPMVIFQAGTNTARPFSWVFQGRGGSSLTTNMYEAADGSLNVVGTTAGTTAATGWVGEFLAVTNGFATGTNLTSTLDTNALKLTLTAGDWSVVGTATFASSSASAKATQLKASIGTVNNTVNSDGTQVYNWPNVTNNAFTASVTIAAPVRVTVNTSTTVFLNANATFSSGPLVVYGVMEATRIR